MHTADARRPNQSEIDLSSSQLYIGPSPVLKADPKVAIAPDLAPAGCSEKISTLFSEAETATATDDPNKVPGWKRALDVICILFSLPLWLPIFLLIALWIKIASPGPIFFRQERIGNRGRRFMIFKFRTMKVNVETQSHERHLDQLIHANCPMTKLDASGDPRIIPGGRILRATGLDELAQLFNVLRGEMSLVGPRPCTPHEFTRYQGWQRERINAPPGLTGYWQVNGKNKTTFTEMINMDIFYTKNMSLWLDLAIIVRTLPAIITQVIEARLATRSGTRASARDSGNKPAGQQC